MAEDIKPGRVTTEFGLTAILGALAAIQEATEGLSDIQMLAVTSIAIAYILSRAWVKGQAARPAPIILEDKP